MIRRPPRSTQSRSSAASDVYKRQTHYRANWPSRPSSNSSTSRPRRITIAKNFVIAEYSYILQFGLSALLGLYEDLSDFSCVEFSGKTFRYFVHKHNSSAQLFRGCYLTGHVLSLIHISEPTRLGMISYAVFCLKKKKNTKKNKDSQTAAISEHIINHTDSLST